MSSDRSDVNGNLIKVRVGAERAVSTGGESKRKSLGKLETRRSPILSTIFEEAGLSSYSECRGSGDISTSQIITVDKKCEEDVTTNLGFSRGSSLSGRPKLVKNTARKSFKYLTTPVFRSPVRKQTARKSFLSPSPSTSSLSDDLDTSSFSFYENSLLSSPVRLGSSTCSSDDEGFELVQPALKCCVAVNNITSPLDGRNKVLISEEYWLKNEWTEARSYTPYCQVRGRRTMVKSTDGSKTPVCQHEHENSDFSYFDHVGLVAESDDPELVCSDSELIKTSPMRSNPRRHSSRRHYMDAMNLDGENWSFHSKSGREQWRLSPENRAPGSSLPIFKRYSKRAFNEKLVTSKLLKSLSSVKHKQGRRPSKMSEVDGSNRSDLQNGAKRVTNGTLDTFSRDSDLMEISHGEFSDILESNSFPDEVLSEHDVSMETPVKTVAVSKDSKVQPSPEQTRRTLASIKTWRKRQIKVEFIDENDVLVFGTRIVNAKSGKRGRPRHIKEVFCREKREMTEIEKAGQVSEVHADEPETEWQSTAQPHVGANETTLRDEEVLVVKKSLVESNLSNGIEKMESESDKSIGNDSIGANSEREKGRAKRCTFSLDSQSISIVKASDTKSEMILEPVQSVRKTLVNESVGNKRVMKCEISSSPIVSPLSHSPSEFIARNYEPLSPPELSPSKSPSPKLSLPPKPTRKSIVTVVDGTEGSKTGVASDVVLPVSMARWLTLAGKQSEDERFRKDSRSARNQISSPQTESVPKPLVDSVKCHEIAGRVSVKPLRNLSAESVGKSTRAIVELDAPVLGEDADSPSTESPFGLLLAPIEGRKILRKQRRAMYEPPVWLPVEDMQGVRDKAFRTHRKCEWSSAVGLGTAPIIERGDKNRKSAVVTEKSVSLANVNLPSDEVQYVDGSKATTSRLEKADEENPVDDGSQRTSSNYSLNIMSTPVKMSIKSNAFPPRIKCETRKSMTEKCQASLAKEKKKRNHLELVDMEKKTRKSEMVVVEGKKRELLLWDRKRRSWDTSGTATPGSTKDMSVSRTLICSNVEHTKNWKRVEELIDVYAFSLPENTVEMVSTGSKFKLEDVSEEVVNNRERRSRSSAQSNGRTRASERAHAVCGETAVTSTECESEERKPIELSRSRKRKSSVFALATNNVPRSKRHHSDIESEPQDSSSSGVPNIKKKRKHRLGIKQENEREITESENSDWVVGCPVVNFNHTNALSTPLSFVQDSTESDTGSMLVKPGLLDIKPVIDAVLPAGPISPVKYHFSEFVDNTFDHGTDDLQEYIINNCTTEDIIDMSATPFGNLAKEPCRNHESNIAADDGNISRYNDATRSLSLVDPSAAMECTNRSNCSLNSTVSSSHSTLNDSVRDMESFSFVSDEKMCKSEDFQSPGYRAEQARARIQRLREKLLTQHSELKTLKL